ncbi:MAG: histidine phosphatase family protein [Xanthomonadaceae bacterium]|nr:histidine phosphatase family protein [Xanthomonadaceae bacterium]
MGSLLLIRHGQACFGSADYDRLSPLGELQSQRLGQWLKQAGQAPDLIAVGPLRRHAQTADLCVAAAAVTAPRIMVADLDEIDHEEILARHRPDLATAAQLSAEMAGAGDPHRAFQRLFAAAVARWVSGEFDGEYTRSWGAFRAATLQGLQALAAHGARTIWAFTSGGTIAVMVNALVGAPAGQAFALSWPLVNTSLTRIRTGAQRHSLVSYNSWPHLEHADAGHLVTHR